MPECDKVTPPLFACSDQVLSYPINSMAPLVSLELREWIVETMERATQCEKRTAAGAASVTLSHIAVDSSVCLVNHKSQDPDHDARLALSLLTNA